MTRFILTAVLTGLLFGIMDGLINGNPLATKLYDCYKPIAKQSINVPAGIVIDLFYGFAITAIYTVIVKALPSESGVVRGLSYGLGIWFFRVFMNVLTNWMMFDIPVKTLVYILLTGLVEMLLLGLLNGILIKR